LGSPLFCIFARFCFWYQPFFPEFPDMSWIQSSTMWMPLSIEEFLNNAQFLNFWWFRCRRTVDRHAKRSHFWNDFEIDKCSYSGAISVAGQWVCRTAILTGLIARRPVSSSWSGFHDVSNVMSISVSPRSEFILEKHRKMEFILEKRLSLSLCLRLFRTTAIGPLGTWVLGGFCWELYISFRSLPSFRLAFLSTDSSSKFPR